MSGERTPRHWRGKAPDAKHDPILLGSVDAHGVFWDVYQLRRYLSPRFANLKIAARGSAERKGNYWVAVDFDARGLCQQAAMLMQMYRPDLAAAVLALALEKGERVSSTTFNRNEDLL